MLIRETSPPSSEPVTLTELKAHCRIDGTDEDIYLTSLITAARKAIERRLDIAGITRTLEIVLDRFPRYDHLPIRLPVSPLIAVSSITYRDSDGVTQTWSNTEYEVIAGEGGYIIADINYGYPDTDTLAGCVTITGTFGYASVPGDFAHAVKLLAAAWYENREAVGDRVMTPIPNGLKFILDGLRQRAY